MLRAIIFDFDGVLADTEPLHFRAFRDVLGREGFELTEEEYFARYVGLNDLAFLAAFFSDRNRTLRVDESSRLHREKDAAYMATIQRSPPPVMGAALIRRTRQQWPLAICSGARRTEIETILNGENLRSHFEVIVSADDCRESKPDPAGFLQTIRLLDRARGPIAASECVAIEDSLHGVRAARAAGMKVVAVGDRAKGDVSRAADAWAPGLDELDEAELLSLFRDAPTE